MSYCKHGFLVCLKGLWCICEPDPTESHRRCERMGGIQTQASMTAREKDEALYFHMGKLNSLLFMLSVSFSTDFTMSYSMVLRNTVICPLLAV